MTCQRGFFRSLILFVFPVILSSQTPLPDWWVPLFDRNSMQLPQMVKIGDGLVVDWGNRLLLAPGTTPQPPVEIEGPPGPMGAQGIQGIPGPVGPRGPPGSGTGGSSTRVYGVRLSRTSSGNWLLPLGALPNTLVLAVDRWPVYQGIDYDILGSEIIPRYPWITFANRPPLQQLVMADFDR